MRRFAYFRKGVVCKMMNVIVAAVLIIGILIAVKEIRNKD